MTEDTVDTPILAGLGLGKSEIKSPIIFSLFLVRRLLDATEYA